MLAELAVGIGLLFGIASRLAAVGGLVLIGPIWIMLWHTGLYLWQYPAEDLFPLVLLAIAPADVTSVWTAGWSKDSAADGRSKPRYPNRDPRRHQDSPDTHERERPVLLIDGGELGCGELRVPCAARKAPRRARSHATALAGIAQARDLGFTVKVAATLYDTEVDTADELNTLLDTMNIPTTDRIIRPVAQQGFAEQGEHVHIDTLQPEPTLTADGVWWHPVAVTDPAMQVATSPLPVSEALDTIRDTLATQDAAQREGRRHVFRCA